jgi:glycogen operon protein
MPPFEKPSEGGYWGYSTLSFFIPENTYSSAYASRSNKTEQQEIIDEFKWMVDQFHQADIEVYLDVVYNHTGEGGFWRERLDFDFNPDNSIPTGLVNIDPKEVVGLYNYRGFDNHAYYALTEDQQSYVNNTGVGNETRCNHTPFPGGPARRRGQTPLRHEKAQHPLKGHWAWFNGRRDRSAEERLLLHR